jgi:hypothetical protein
MSYSGFGFRYYCKSCEKGYTLDHYDEELHENFVCVWCRKKGEVETER